jgi:hypothetical protein
VLGGDLRYHGRRKTRSASGQKPYSIPPFYLNETKILQIFGMQEFFLLLKGVEGKVR